MERGRQRKIGLSLLAACGLVWGIKLSGVGPWLLAHLTDPPRLFGTWIAHGAFADATLGIASCMGIIGMGFLTRILGQADPPADADRARLPTVDGPGEARGAGLQEDHGAGTVRDMQPVWRNSYGTPTHAPCFSDNARGTQPWSGKSVQELTAIDLVDMLDFCVEEGARRGWNDEHYQRFDEDEAAMMFHPDFLRGYPYAYWTGWYTRGRESYRVERTEQA